VLKRRISSKVIKGREGIDLRDMIRIRTRRGSIEMTNLEEMKQLNLRSKKKRLTRLQKRGPSITLEGSRKY